MTNLLRNEPDGLAIDFTDTGSYNSSTWAQTWNQKRSTNVDTFSSPHTFYTNSSTSPKSVKTSAAGLGWAPHNQCLQSQTLDIAQQRREAKKPYGGGPKLRGIVSIKDF